MVGTRDMSGRCNVQTGLCICNAGLGYTGDKCDGCVDGWYLNDSDNTCASKIISVSEDVNVLEENVLPYRLRLQFLRNYWRFACL